MKHLLILVLLYVSTSFNSFCFSQVVINEIQSSNSSTIDDLGETSDWIELFNTSSSEFDLSGYHLSDLPSDSVKWTFPSGTKILPKGYLIIYADGKNIKLHTNFKLSSAGEFVVLTDKTGKLIDSHLFPELLINFSYGRTSDGGSDFSILTTATPGKSNIVSVLLGQAGLPIFSLAGGFYTGEHSLTISTAFPNGVIHYTIDGSEPTEKSPVYSKSLQLAKVTKETQRKGVMEYLYPASFAQNPKYSGQRDFATVVKAKVFCPNYIPGKTVGATYFIDMRKPTLPVISLSTDSYHLFSDTAGIYVKGTKGAVEYVEGQAIYANWFNGWEKPAYFEFYDESGVQQVRKKVGISVMGDVSKNSDQKSFHVETKSSYENGNLDYKFFKDSKISSFSALSLRASGNDWKDGNMCRDGIIQAVVKDRMNLDCQEYQPAVLYINGEYFGLQNIRERLSAEYCEEHFKNVDAKNVDFLKLDWVGYSASYVAKSGDTKMFDEMYDFFNNRDLKVDSNYQKVATKYIDIDAFINYYIAEIYLSNDDWPYNNIRLWRPKTDGGKFRWILYDTDFGYGIWGRSPSNNDFFRLLDANDWPGYTNYTLFFRKLIENSTFKNEFIQRFAYHLNTTYQTPRLKNIALKIESLVKEERDNYSDKEWARWVSSSGSVASMISWNSDRNGIVRDQLNMHKMLGSGYGYSLFSAQANDTIQGYIKLCTQKLETKYSGLHYNNIPINLEAVANKGYHFICWKDEKGTILSTKNTFEISITSDRSVFAVFGASTSLFSLNDKKVSGVEVSVSPNPSSGLVDVEVSSLNPQDITIEVVNGTGLPLFSKRIFVDGHVGLKLDLADFTKGLYIVRASSVDAVGRCKLLLM